VSGGIRVKSKVIEGPIDQRTLGVNSQREIKLENTRVGDLEALVQLSVCLGFVALWWRMFMVVAVLNADIHRLLILQCSELV
jgi:hypothetical protein